MKITNEWLNEKFAELNEKYFDGTLNNVRFEIAEKTLRHMGICSIAKKECGLCFNVMKNSKKQIFVKTTYGDIIDITAENAADWFDNVITMYANDDAPESMHINTLCHEMVHAYCNNKGLYCGHTGLFKMVAANIAYKSNNQIYITTYFDGTDLLFINNPDRIKQLNDVKTYINKSENHYVPVIMITENNTIDVLFTTNDMLLSDIQGLKKHYSEMRVPFNKDVISTLQAKYPNAIKGTIYRNTDIYVLNNAISDLKQYMIY